MNRSRLFTPAALALSLLAAACGEKVSAPATADDAPAAAVAQADAPAPTGDVVEIRMITDERGNLFEPAQVTAKPGDVLRFVLVSGVHNVSFPPDQNPGAQGLPGPSDYAQLPGQTLEVPVTFSAGEYAFQCDPHAALGMVGTLTVQ